VRGAGTSAGGGPDRLAAYRYEIDGFCSAIRTGTPLKCGPEAAMSSAVACIAGFEAIETKQRVVVEKA
jgi:predicted dehydrogenase